jgi:LCP family protein required for cell wall assembly
MLDSIQPKNPQFIHALGPPSFEKPKPKRKSIFGLGLGISILILLAVGIFIGSKLVIFAQKIIEGENSIFSFGQLFIAPDKKLQGEEQGLVRILLMGIGGEKHEGGTLTDTMILATFKLPQNKDEEIQVGLVSIPRDLTVNIHGYDYRKINSAYAYGESGGQKQGPALAIQTVENVLGLKIPYYGVIDFEGFKKIIDDLGGIEVNVEVGFTDAQYPDEKEGYLPPITFEPGNQLMNGERALEFVRSRHGNNNQGSDFARARRQQLVLKAVKEEVTTFRVLTNLSLIDRILKDLSDHIRTNLQPFELKRLYTLAHDLKDENIRTLTIDEQSGLVCGQITEDTQAYILIPCRGLENYENIRDFVNNQFLIAPLQAEQASIEIQNATSQTGLGQKTLNTLYKPSLKITTSNFKGQTSFSQSIIYDNTGGKKPKTLEYLKTKLNLPVAQSPFPFSTSTPLPDFVIVVTPDLEGKLQ